MEDGQQRQVLKIIVLLAVWVVLFEFVVGPIIDAALPGTQRSSFQDDDPGTRGDLPDTVRGVAATITGAVVLVSYYLLRALFVEHSVSE